MIILALILIFVGAYCVEECMDGIDYNLETGEPFAHYGWLWAACFCAVGAVWCIIMLMKAK